jgi:DNA processing protein
LKQGAIPVTSVDDILEVIGAQHDDDGLSLARPVPELSSQEMVVWQALSAAPHHVDELARGLRLRSGEVAATLAVLELKGLARQVGSMLYTRPE